MRVRLTVTVNAADRYVIAKYYGRGARARRSEVRAFVQGALSTSLREQGDALTRRQRGAVRKLRERDGSRPEPALREPSEKQMTLWS